MLRLAPRPSPIKTALKKLYLIAIAGVMAFTLAQPAHVLGFFNTTLSPKNVPPLRSQKVPVNFPEGIGKFAPVSADAPEMTVDDKFTKQDEAQNIDRKRLRELPELRTEYTSTYLNEDGTKTLEFSTIQQNYKEDGQWKKIDNTIETFTESGKLGFRADAGKAGVSLRSLHSGISLVGGNDSVIMKPVGTGDIRPEKEGDYSVIYKEAWPGVDLRYEIVGGTVKEYTIIKNKSAKTNFDYDVTGGKVVIDKSTDGALAVEGVDGYRFSPLTLSVNDRGIISENRVSQVPTANGLRVSIDAKWFNQQPDSAFPMVIDPSWESNTAEVVYKMYKSDGYYCPSSSCYANTGSLYDGGWKHWRTYVKFPYSQLANKNIIGAAMNGIYQSGAGGTGVSSTIYLGDASCSNGFSCFGTQVATDTGVTTNFGIYFNQKLQELVDANNFDNWWSVKGVEGSATTFKPYRAIWAYVNYDTPTPMATANAPVDKSVITHTQPSLKVGKVSDADPGDTVQYYFRVATGQDAESGAVINSGWITANQWTVPEHILQDGTTYYWHVYTRGNQSAPNTNPDWVRSFKVDLRTGKDSTQAYDSVGPVSVDLATGNLTTSVQSHSIGALGGDIGLSLNYNSPAMSRPGVVGQYWNNGSFSGEPKITRVDSDINFDWGTGSPDPLIGVDNFSARWTGYLVPRQSGTYSFGCNVDDTCKVWVDDVLHVNRTSYGTGTGPSAYYEAGVPVKLKVEMTEITSGAAAKLLVNGEPISDTWFITVPRIIKSNYGLKGWYYNDPAATYNFPSNPTDPSRLLMVRNDNKLTFNWQNGSPSPGLPNDNFLIRWKGYLTVPETGSYKVGARADDRVRIMLGTGAGGTDETVLNSWTGYTQTDLLGTAKTLTKGQKVPITVEYAEQAVSASFKLLIAKGSDYEGNKQEMPVTWLTRDANILPAGWEMSVGLGSARFEKLVVKSDTVTLSDGSGQKYEFAYDSSKKSYKPPKGESALLTRNEDNTYTLTDADGSVYLFDVEGRLTSWVGPQDDRQPAALKYEYGGNPERLTHIIDGVDSDRYGTLYYSGASECVTGSGFDAAPAGMLCAFGTTDGDFTYFQYKGGALARVQTPGNANEDFRYDDLGRLDQYQDILANDAVAFGVRTNNDDIKTLVTYDAVGRVSSIKSPIPAPGAARYNHTYDYLHQATEKHIEGASEPNGFTQKIEYDDLFRTVKSIDAAGLETLTEWDNDKDLVLSTTDPLGLKSTTIYNDEDIPTDTYGPAPAAWFDTNRKPLSAYIDQIPHTKTKYDEGIAGFDVSWYNLKSSNMTFFGTPILNTLGFAGPGSPENGNPAYARFDYTTHSKPVEPDTSISGVDGYGIRARGKLTFPGTGTYTFWVPTDDSIRIYVDGKRLIDNWGTKTSGSDINYYTADFTGAESGKAYDIQIDYGHTGAERGFAVYIDGAGITDDPGSTHGTRDWSNFLKPGYNLTTSTTAYDSVLGDTVAQTQYSDPTYGLIDKTIIDPTGLNLQNQAAYETPGTGYLRQTGRTTAGGSQYTYQYYGDTEAVDNPCTVNNDPVSQAGRAKGKTEPDPDGAGPQTPRTTETVYNASGAVVATRFNDDPWTCITYDARGRQVESVQPTINGRAGRTVTNYYVVDNNPLKDKTVDSVAGTTERTIDLLGRVVSSEDVWGNEYTAAYDDFGNITQKTGPLGVEEFVYDNLYRLTDYKLDSTTLAVITYDAYGRVNTVTYPQAKDGSSDPLKLTQIKRDDLQRSNGIMYETSDGEIYDEDLVLSQLGKVIGVTQEYDNQTLNSEFDYDGVGRLTSATVGETQFDYGYGAPDSATCSPNSANNANAHKNSNRTSYTVTTVTTSTIVVNDKLCYDNADKLTYSTDVNIGTPTYDDHGNTISFAGNGTAMEFEYDAGDHNIAVQQGDKRTEYTKTSDGLVLRKKEFNDNNLTASYRYVAGGSILQTCSLTDDDDCATIDKYISLPGNVTLTLSPSNPDTDKQTVYSLKSYHGDTVLTLTGEGKTSSTNNTLLGYGPFGEPLITGTLGTTTDSALNSTDTTQGWAASPTRKQDTTYTTTFIQMGARVYIPTLGRFLQVDPVEGGTENPYAYASDPINYNDYNGRLIWFVPILVAVVRVVVQAAIPVIIPKIIPVIVKAAKSIAPKVVQTAKSFFKPVVNTGKGTQTVKPNSSVSQVRSITIGPKIQKQMPSRGWTEERVNQAVQSPTRTVVTRDTRYDPLTSSRFNDPATAYYHKDGGYVVINDRTGAIVQVQNLNKTGWKTPWDPIDFMF